MRNFKASITIAAFAVLVFIQGVPALAAPLIGLDPAGTGNYTTYADLWTNLTDTGLSVGFDPAATATPYDTTFVYQSRIGAMQSNGAVVTPSGLNSGNGGFEITLQTKIPETVVSEKASTDSTGATRTTALFSHGADTGATMTVFFDPRADANPNSVSGYGDGTQIMSAHLQKLNASFDTVTSGASAGTGTGSFDALFIIDSVNTKYLDLATGSVFGIESTGTMNLPSFFKPGSMWDGTPASTGIPLKLDSSESFSAIPEPSTFLLLGAGLLGLAGFSRTRKK